MKDNMTSRILEFTQRINGYALDPQSWEVVNNKMILLERAEWEHFLSGVEIAAKLIRVPKG